MLLIGVLVSNLREIGKRTHHKKKGSQQSIKTPIIIPKVRAALCSRFILIKCLSLVGVCSGSISFIVNAFDDPVPLSASPAKKGKEIKEQKQLLFIIRGSRLPTY